MSKEEGEKIIDEAYDGLERETPGRLSRAIHWLRQPEARWVRWPLGLLLIAGGFFGYLPILGIEMIPVGVLLIAQDIPFLRKPVGKAVLWIEHKWVALRRWWKRKRARRN